jgi:hypothetical protein
MIRNQDTTLPIMCQTVGMCQAGCLKTKSAGDVRSHLRLITGLVLSIDSWSTVIRSIALNNPALCWIIWIIIPFARVFTRRDQCINSRFIFSRNGHIKGLQVVVKLIHDPWTDDDG